MSHARMDETMERDKASRPMTLGQKLWLDPLYFRWITTAVWAAGVGVTFGVIGDFSIFYIFLEREFNSTTTELSWLGASTWCLFCLVAPLSIIIAQKCGFRWTMIGSCAVGTIGLLATSFAHALWPMFITYSLLLGSGTVMVYTVGCVYVTRYFDEKTCTGPVSTGGTAFELAILVFSPLIQTTAEAWGWRWSVRLLAGIALVATILLAVFTRTPPNDDEESSVNGTSDEVTTKDTDGDISDDKREDDGDEYVKDSSKRRYLRMCKMPSFWILQFGIVVSFTALSFNHINLGSYLTSVGISDRAIAIMHSCLAGGALFGRVVVIVVAHRLPSMLFVYPVIAVIYSGASVVILIARHQWVCYIYSTVAGMLRACYFSLSTGVALEVFGKESAAEGYVCTFVSWGIGSALAATIPGITHDLTNSYTASVVVCAVFWGTSAVLFAVVYFLVRRQRHLVANSSKLYVQVKNGGDVDKAKMNETNSATETSAMIEKVSTV